MQILKQFLGSQGPLGEYLTSPRYPRLFPVLLVGMGFLQCYRNTHGTDPVPNLPNQLNGSGIQYNDRILREND